MKMTIQRIHRRMKAMRPSQRSVIVGLLAVTTLPGGCRQRERSPEVFSLEGKIEDIKTTAGGQGEITVIYYSEKHGQEVVGTALVTKETEIMINGAIAELSQIKEGERVRGDVLVDRSGEERTYRILKMHIDRPSEQPPAGPQRGEAADKKAENAPNGG